MSCTHSNAVYGVVSYVGWDVVQMSWMLFAATERFGNSMISALSMPRWSLNDARRMKMRASKFWTWEQWTWVDFVMWTLKIPMHCKHMCLRYLAICIRGVEHLCYLVKAHFHLTYREITMPFVEIGTFGEAVHQGTRFDRVECMLECMICGMAHLWIK